MAKRWCFTLNNPTEVEQFALNNIDQLEGPSLQYIIWQTERGENGTKHIQGFLILKKQQRLSWLQKHISARAHFEVARGNNKQASEYCKKDDTYTGEYRYEWGELPVTQVKKRDERLQEAAEELDTLKEVYKRPAEIPSMTLMQCGFIPAMKEITADILGPYRPNLRVITMVGPPGTGKSYCIQKHFPNHGRCICGNSGTWFQNPCAEVMVFEEFCGQIQLQRMLQYLDPYPHALEVKGGMRPAMYTTVVITSNTRPEGWYKGDEGFTGKRNDAILALYDRLGYSTGYYVPVRDCGVYLEPPADMCVADCRRYFDRSVYQIIHGHEDISDDEQPQAASAAAVQG